MNEWNTNMNRTLQEDAGQESEDSRLASGILVSPSPTPDAWLQWSQYRDPAPAGSESLASSASAPRPPADVDSGNTRPKDNPLLGTHRSIKRRPPLRAHAMARSAKRTRPADTVSTSTLDEQPDREAGNDTPETGEATTSAEKLEVLRNKISASPSLLEAEKLLEQMERQPREFPGATLDPEPQTEEGD